MQGRWGGRGMLITPLVISCKGKMISVTDDFVVTCCFCCSGHGFYSNDFWYPGDSSLVEGVMIIYATYL